MKSTLHSIFEDEDLREKLEELRERNGGQLKLSFYLKEGSDGSSGQPIIKKVLRNMKIRQFVLEFSIS